VTASLTLGGAALLAGAGLLAGVVGTSGGITSLVSYPALLAAGVAAQRADVTNIVALVVCWPGSALASRRELAGSGPWLRPWAGVSAGAGALGAVLLVATPASAFAGIVPWLVLAAAALLVAQPRTSQRSHQPMPMGPHPRSDHLGPQPGHRRLLRFGIPAIMVYNGYFGAGAGIMTLGLMLQGVDPHLPRANAYKNVLIGAATLAAAVVVSASGEVAWVAAGPLAAGLAGGSLLGPLVARRVPPGILRWLAALSGAALAAYLWTG
jgi:uncharacterized membrane protein YfcA